VLYLESIVRITASSSQTPPALGGGISTSQLPPAANPPDTTALQPVVFQLHSYHQQQTPPDTTALQPVVLQFLGYPLRANFPLEELFAYAKHPNHQGLASCKIKVPPAEAWWCLRAI
jgi:hypothetical protein